MKTKIYLRLKWLLLCCFLLLSVNMMADGTDYYYKVTATASPTGEGKVYVSDKQETPTSKDYADVKSIVHKEQSSQQAASKEFYLFSQPAEGYVFDYWTSSDGKVFSRMQSPSTGILSSNKTKKEDPAIFSYTAHFSKKGVVYVASEDESVGTAGIDIATNKVGDKVTLTASADMYSGQFKAWTKDGKVVSTDNPFTFTVTEDNKGKYVATFDNIDMAKTGFYCIVKNVKFKRNLGLMGISDNNVSRDNRYLKNSIMLLESNSDVMHASPAFVLKITGTTDGTGGLDNTNMAAQGMDSKSIANKTYTFSKHGDHFYIYGSAGSSTAYMVDFADAFTQEEGVGKVNHPGLYNGANENDGSYHWQVIPITRNSTDAYFGAMPSEQAKVGDKYYTTMYTAFPYECLDGVKAYTVDKINADGTVHLKEITSGKVPSKTAVVLACNSTKPNENRLLPLLEEPAAVEGDNLLKGERWLKDENKAEDEYRTKFDASTMRVLGNTTGSFDNVNNSDVLEGTGSTGTLTYIKNNTCYLDVSNVENPAASYTLSTKEPVKAIEGYYRIQNGYGITENNGKSEDGHYVQVTDAAWAAPNQKADEAKTEPGSVIYLKATPVSDDMLRVDNLRSQGIEVVGGTDRKDFLDLYNSLGNMTAEQRYEYLRKAQQEGYIFTGRALLEAGIYAVANELVKGYEAPEDVKTLSSEFNKQIADALDIDMYMTRTQLTNGQEAWTLKEHVLEFDDISDFVTKNMSRFEEGFKAMRKVWGTTTGETIEADEVKTLSELGYNIQDDKTLPSGEYPVTLNADGSCKTSYEAIFTHPELLYYWLKLNVWKMLNNPDNYKDALQSMTGSDYLYKAFKEVGSHETVMRYIRRLHYDTDYYLIDGYVSNGTEGNEGDQYTNLGRFGFCNNNTTSSYYPAELSTAKDGGKWVLKQVTADDDSYFGIKASDKFQGLDGHYYSTLCVDFPIDVTKCSEGLHFYSVDGNLGEAVTRNYSDGQKWTYRYITLNEITDVVPAGLPVIVETENIDASKNRIVPMVSDKTYEGTTLLKGIFFNAGKSNASDSYGSVIENIMENLFDYKYDNMTNALNHRYGISYDATSQKIFTLQKNANDTHNPMGFYHYTGTSLSHNKAFMVIDNSAVSAGAKIYIGYQDGTVTGVDNINVDSTQHHTDAIYDLQGRRVAKPMQGGIYIINGKKVVITK